MHDGRIQWHPAFSAALQIELQEDAYALTFEDEHLLGKKPMQIDIVVIKKLKDVHIHKNIGHIFKTYNIIEYKSPTDSLSVNDFYKVYGYACFYQSDTETVEEIDPKEITITFVCNHYPHRMLNHIHEIWGITTEKYDSGIYLLSGSIFLIQLIITHQLCKEDNYWLQCLRDDLKAGGEISQLVENYELKKSSPMYEALVDVILRANWKEVEVEKRMCDALKELFADELQESEEKGAEKMRQLTRKLLHDHRLDDLSRATENSEFCKSLMQEYHI